MYESNESKIACLKRKSGFINLCRDVVSNIHGTEFSTIIITRDNSKVRKQFFWITKTIKGKWCMDLYCDKIDGELQYTIQMQFSRNDEAILYKLTWQ